MHCCNCSGAPTTVKRWNNSTLIYIQMPPNHKVMENTFKTHQSTTREVARPVAKDVKTCQMLLSYTLNSLYICKYNILWVWICITLTNKRLFVVNPEKLSNKRSCLPSYTFSQVMIKAEVSQDQINRYTKLHSSRRWNQVTSATKLESGELM